MITASDPAYQDTLLVKRGQKIMPVVFAQLLAWINKKYSVRAINLCYDQVRADHQPRIEIVFESGADLQKFCTSTPWNYDKAIQRKIADEFEQMVKAHGSQNEYPTDRLIVNYSDFAAIARGEAGNQLPREQRMEFLKTFIKDPVWEIHLHGAALMVFFFEEGQVSRYRDSPLIEEMKREYYSLIKPFDEFGYIHEITVGFDSKEEFDRKYGGNWLNYYR